MCDSFGVACGDNGIFRRVLICICSLLFCRNIPMASTFSPYVCCGDCKDYEECGERFNVWHSIPPFLFVVIPQSFYSFYSFLGAFFLFFKFLLCNCFDVIFEFFPIHFDHIRLLIRMNIFSMRISPSSSLCFRGKCLCVLACL